jgi:hypothetical protein
MKITIESLKELLQKFMQLFSSANYSGINYKEQLLAEAIDDEERQDLEELFESTDAFYAEKEEMRQSNMTGSEYLQSLYLKSWKESNPNASEDEIKNAIREYESILSEGVIKELDSIKLESQNDSLLTMDEADDTEIETIEQEKTNTHE